MDIHGVPDDVLILVLQASRSLASSARRAFKDDLRLLSVCRRWRQLGTRMVYDHLFIRHTEAPKGHAETATNLGLIALNGCAGAVKWAEISIGFSSTPLGGLAGAVDAMRRAGNAWRALRSLRLGLHPAAGGNAAESDDGGGGDSDGDARAAALACYSTMPRLRQLHIAGSDKWAPARPLCEHLAGVYADQLQQFSCLRPLSLPQGRAFAQLQDASVSHGPGLPRMCPGSLRRLAVTGAPADHSWAAFGAEPETTFPGLRVLRLDYTTARAPSRTEGGSVGRRRQRLHLPVLRVLKVVCPARACPALDYAVLPASMDSVSIRATAAVFRSIAGMRLPAVRRLMLAVVGGPDGEDVFPSINRILAGARASKTKALHVESSALPVSAEAIECADLTRLYVAAPTGVGTMLQLVQRLPSLTHIGFSYLELPRAYAGIGIPGPGERCPVEPFGTRLEQFDVRIRGSARSSELFVPVAKFLLLKIPTLATFLASNVPRDPLVVFIGEYSAQYPHLGKVAIEPRE
ncbi:hypothetical protein H4R18_001623 [Coemansia javaensis]|uniref:Uncharacterized protein n=1 Tax=Coemansia javaensis TaxID=2761396 RepID=A0A9W8HK18_9FUNG|nr:hypothetical protein H4R18_001623 [Coemansia javaensis]